MFNQYINLSLAVAIGISIATQSGVNSQLRVHLPSPLHAAFLSFLFGSILLLMLIYFRGGSLSDFRSIGTIPPYLFLGGVFGVFNIALAIYLVPNLGALSLTVSIIIGQISASIIYDYFGIVGYPKTDIGMSKIIGLVLMIFGVYMVTKK